MRLIVQRAGSPAYCRAAEVAKVAAESARRILGSGVEVLWFGSWPRGRAHERSDIDLALRSPTRLSHERLREVREAIDELPTLYSIDVVDIDRASEDLRAEIERYGERL